MPGIDVARYALLGITAPPFRTDGASLFAPKTIKYTFSVLKQIEKARGSRRSPYGEV